MNEQIEFFRKLINERLSEERIVHTLGVEAVAKELAPQNGIDVESACIAALSHDMAKNLSCGEQIRKAQEWKLIYYPEDIENPQILHGRLAAYMLKNEYGIKDEDILRAIANHTLGRPKMSKLEMLIYSADMVEEGRTFPGVDNLREKLYDDLVEGTFSCVQYALHYLIEEGKDIHPLTILTYGDLVDVMKRKNLRVKDLDFGKINK